MYIKKECSAPNITIVICRKWAHAWFSPGLLVTCILDFLSSTSIYYVCNNEKLSFQKGTIIINFFLINLFIYLFLAALGLRCCAWAFSSCSKRGLLFVAVHGLLIVVASHCGAWALGTRASVVVAHGLSTCGSRAVEHGLSSCGARA